MITMRVSVDQSVKDSLAKANPRDLRRFLSKATKAASKPTLESVRQLTPVKTGKLRASWGSSSFYDRVEGEVGVVIEPRNNFTFVSSSGVRMLTTSRGKTHKKTLKAISKGRTISQQSPWDYAFGIETGTKPKGGLARKAGGARMLSRGLEGNASRFIETVGSDVIRFILTPGVS